MADSKLPPERRVNYDWIAKLNDGLYDSDRKSRKRKAERKRDLEIFANCAELTSDQKQNVFYLNDLIENIGSFHSEESFLLSLITMVANVHGRRIRGEEAFDELREDCNVNRKTIRKGRRKIREMDVIDYLKS